MAFCINEVGQLGKLPCFLFLLLPSSDWTLDFLLQRPNLSVLQWKIRHNEQVPYVTEIHAVEDTGSGAGALLCRGRRACPALRACIFVGGSCTRLVCIRLIFALRIKPTLAAHHSRPCRNWPFRSRDDITLCSVP